MNRRLTGFLAAASLFIVWALDPLSIAGGRALAQDGSGGFSKANLDLPFDAGGQNEEEEEAPEIVVFYGQQYEGDGIFFCCDKSGSMKEEGKWRKLQSEVVKNISQFSEKVQFALVFFDASMNKFPQSGKPAEASPPLKAAAAAMVMSTQPGSGTCTKPALIQSLSFANQSTAKRKVIIYLSDGFQHCPGHDAAAYGKECLNEVTSRNTQRVQINAICIGGVEVDEAWMRALAQQNGGQMARIRN